MIFVIFQLLGKIEELFTSRVNVELAVNNPACRGTVLNCVPDVTVAGNDLVTCCFQFFSCCEE